MSLVATVRPEDAEGEIKNGYDLFVQRGLDVPTPFRLFSASPGIFNLMVQRNRYYSNHPNLSFSLLTHIRYFVSKRLDYTICREHNKKLLLMQGLEEADIEHMGMDPEKSMLEPNECMMVSFVLRAMDAPDSISKQDLDELHAAGWKDWDILDALAQGVGMIDHHIFIQVFKPDF